MALHGLPAVPARTSKKEWTAPVRVLRTRSMAPTPCTHARKDDDLHPLLQERNHSSTEWDFPAAYNDTLSRTLFQYQPPVQRMANLCARAEMEHFAQKLGTDENRGRNKGRREGSKEEGGGKGEA